MSPVLCAMNVKADFASSMTMGWDEDHLWLDKPFTF